MKARVTICSKEVLKMIIFDLKRLLREKNLTMTVVSNMTGISKNTLSLLGNGTSKGIQFDTLQKLCNALDCTPNDLITFSKGHFHFSIEKTEVDEISSTRKTLFCSLYSDDLFKLNVEKNIMLNENDVFAFVIEYSFDTFSLSSGNVFIHAGLPAIEDTYSMNRYGHGYSSLKNTINLFKNLSHDDLQNISKTIAQYVIRKEFKNVFDDNVPKNVIVPFKTAPTELHELIQTFSFTVTNKDGELYVK